MTVCRTRKLKPLGFYYLFSKPLKAFGVIAFIAVFYGLFFGFSEYLSMEAVLPLFILFIVLLFTITRTLGRKLGEKFYAYAIGDDSIYILNIVKTCFSSYRTPKILVTAVSVITALSWIFAFSFVLSLLLTAVTVLIIVEEYIRFSFIMAKSITEEYIDSVIEECVPENAEFVIEKTLDVCSCSGGVKVKVIARMVNPVKGGKIKSVKRTLKIPDNYENSDELASRLKLMM